MLVVYPRTVIESSVYDAATQNTRVRTAPFVEMLHDIAFDYVCLLTGTLTDFASIPFLQTLLKKRPLYSQGGLRCLTNDLAWNADVPPFVTGKSRL